ncbi:ATP-binding protein [Streptomyces sp. MJM8645]|uniref:ATP-binding protein n=2 Tax=Kitasatosporales TaxID=85011 RepID=UPI0007AF5C75|nr:ATP-binding protein [Streptomyces sp. MJM8645]
MMLQELIKARGISRRGAARLVSNGALRESTLRLWCSGESAPHATDLFWNLVEQLEGQDSQRLHPREEWEAALHAAQGETTRGRREWRADSEKRGRKREHAAMNAFVRDRDPQAASYLWWHAQLPVGKTALLTDYARQLPQDADLLLCVLSEKHGTNTRTEFIDDLRRQLQVPEPRRKPSAEAEFLRLLTKAAGRSRRQKRQLLLVVDGLDEDRAWPTTGAPGGTGVASIAALLPAAPAANVRIIVSSRRSGPLPADVPEGHPLRERECLRPLTAGDWSHDVEQAGFADLERLRTTDLGRAVTDLLAVTDSGGGLRAADLAELTGASVEDVNGLLHSREQRCIVSNEESAEIHLLSHPGMPHAIRREWDQATVERCTRRLHAWAAHWREAGWPEGSPTYLLTEYPQLLDTAGERGRVLLDPLRQLRVADALGPQVMLDQLRLLKSEFKAVEVSDPEQQEAETAVRLAAALDLVQRRVGPVPPRAPVLLVQLGSVARACTVARSEPELVLRAARLAEVAVEAARASHPDATAIAREAADCLVRAGRFTPRAGGSFEDACAEVAEAAGALDTLGRRDGAKALFRAVVLSDAAAMDALVEGAVLLSADGPERFVEALEEHAEELSEVDPRAQAMAVDIWATIARASSSRNIANLDRIECLCKAIDLSDGLIVVDTLALAAQALATMGRRSKAWDVLKIARDRLHTALVRLDSPADRAHRAREFSGTMDRMVRAETAAGTGLKPHLDAKLLVTALSQGVRTGVLGDDQLERAEAFLSAVDEQVAAEHAAHLAAKEERRRAHRREVDASAKALTKERKAKRNRAQAPPTRSARRRVRTDEEPSPSTAPGRSPALGNHEPLVGPVTRLRYAEQLVHGGNLELGREQLEAAVRSSLPDAPIALSAGSAEELVRALGMTGEFGQAEQLISISTEPGDRARHLAALSMGCSLGGRSPEAVAYAHEAARLIPRTPHFAMRGAVAQALAHAGDAEAAVAVARMEESADAEASSSVRGRRARRTLVLVAAGLARHDPERAAELIGPSVQLVRRRIGAGRPVGQLPALAELLLALPDPTRPDPELSEAIRLAAEFTNRPRQTWDREETMLLALLRRLGCAPAPGRAAGELEEWLRSLRPERAPHAELALLGSLDGDAANALRTANAAPAPMARAAALAAAAHVLAAAPAALSVEESEDSTVQLCLALAHAGGRPDRTDSDRAAAQGLLRELLADGSWTRAIPLLPLLVPEALHPLSELVAAHINGRTST